MRRFVLHIPALMQTEPPLNHDTAEVGMKDPAQGLSGFNPVAPSGHGRPGSEILLELTIHSSLCPSFPGVRTMKIPPEPELGPCP